MGGTVSKDESLSNLKKEDLTLPDIAIEFPSGTSVNTIPSFSGLKDLLELLSTGIPLLKALIDQALTKWKTLITSKQQQDASSNKRLFAEEKVTRLRDLTDLYHDYLLRYGNDLPKIIEETKVFQGKFSEQIKIVKNAMGDGHISSPSFKIWVNGAAFHVEMLIRLAQLTSEEDSHSVRQAILVYQEDLQQMIGCYRKFREGCIDLSGGSLKDTEQGRHVENISLDKYEVTKYLFEVDKQIPEIEQYFSRLLDRVDDLVQPNPTNSTARVLEMADERMITSGSGPRTLCPVQHELLDDGPEDDHFNVLVTVEMVSRSSNIGLVNMPTSSIGSNSQQWVEAMKIHSLLMKFTDTQVRNDFLNGMLNIPVLTSKLLQEIDQLNSCLSPFLGNHSDTGLSQTAVTMLISLVEEKPEPLNLGALNTVRTCKSWAQILRIIANSDYWDTFNDISKGNRDTSRETGTEFRMGRYPSAALPQDQELRSSSYPEYHQNPHSESVNGISNTRFYYNSQRRNHRSSAPRDFLQSGPNLMSARWKQRKNDNRRGDPCMFCGKPGHKVENCRLNVKCRKCSKWGHSSELCPESKNILKCPICQEDHLGKDCPRFLGKLSF